MSDKFTESLTHATQELINQSAAVAKQLRNPILLPLHTLAASFEHEFCRSMFYALNIPLEQLKALIEHELHALPQARGAQLAIDNVMQNFLQECKEQAAQL